MNESLNREDMLQECLARLEAGEPLEAYLAGLPDDDALLLKKAVRLRETTDTALTSARIAAGRRELLKLVQQKQSPPSLSTWLNKLQPRWVLPAALAGGAFAVFSCLVIFSLLAGLAGLQWINSPSNVAQNPTPATGVGTGPSPLAPTATPAPDPESAMLAEARGRVEVQDSSGSWTPAQGGATVKAGQRVRTGELSGVTLAFYDGSRAQVGPNAEVSVDELNAQKTGQRVVALTQWVGESDHDVASSSDPASRYEVRTPSGVGTAKGTAFHVFVSTTLLVRFDVEEGAVSVTSLNVTVIVVAGQSTVIVSGQRPSEPFFRLIGEGKVERLGPNWRIAGRTFQSHENTVVVGQPQVGDWVAFEARLLPQGGQILDRVVLLERALENRFEFSGRVDAIGAGEWTIAGRAVKVDEQTEIDDNLQVGDIVEVRGGVAQDGALRAARIRLLEDETGRPFEFVGVVNAITETVWTISGITVTIDANTRIESGLVVGEVARVQGRVLTDGTWLAQSIGRAEEDEREFVIVGPVVSVEPWIVAGIAFETDDKTEIDDGIEVGDQVRVEGRILNDGRWVAREIERLENEQPRRFHFVGMVTSLNPWVVGGVPLAVDANTVIDGEVTMGALVRVSGVILPDGTWQAETITRLPSNRGCLNLSTVVRSVDANQIVLLDWQVITLDGNVQVVGEIKIATIVIVSGCIREDGTLIIVNVIVIYQLDKLPVIIIQPRDHDDDDDDDD
ncbi:MAG: DUF5666 domain-containing protein [Anaerolineales bacterium]